MKLQNLKQKRKLSLNNIKKESKILISLLMVNLCLKLMRKNLSSEIKPKLLKVKSDLITTMMSRTQISAKFLRICNLIIDLSQEIIDILLLNLDIKTIKSIKNNTELNNNSKTLVNLEQEMIEFVAPLDAMNTTTIGILTLGTILSVIHSLKNLMLYQP